ncbi:hypothetical protein PGT21_050250 [Puccinia graminis f. sp. tritici]|uniref:Tc1-like transposase DDE domain-containing protein n=1 Tax=Puccinia graminis f. sp. tritici TaxID=56615 RepID=A0A5B0NSJ7_PUCGR|nr:hypothetical protein PGT21_050250 [Puccinia graminis f. sp. tritici]KAA1097097.1 hypothetical protein PGTUg99_050134 [Puccinia graminis f. sp. tritici]
MPYRFIEPGIKIAVVRMVTQSYSQRFICETLGEPISKQFFARWMKLYQNTQRVIRDPAEYNKRGPGLLLTPDDRVFMIELLRLEPGLFLDEMRERLYDQNDSLLSITTLHRMLVEHLEVTLKKANTVSIKKSLVAKYAYVVQMMTVPADFLVFTDESSVCSKQLLRTFSRSTKGTAADRVLVDQNAKRFTLIPAICLDGVVALTVTDENVKGRNFAHFLKFILLPRMNAYPARNSILVLDNAQIHANERIAKLCADVGVRLVYLPPYCPELNPIELVFLQVKSNLRRLQVLVTSQDPVWAIESTTYRVASPRLCQKLFHHAGYDCPESSGDQDMSEFYFCE